MRSALPSILPLLWIVFTAAPGKAASTVHPGGEADYLVTLEETTGRDPATVADQLTASYGGTVITVWQSAVRGFLLRARPQIAAALATDPVVARVEPNRKLGRSDPLPSCFPNLRQATDSGNGSPQAVVCDDPDPRNPDRVCTDNWGLDRIDQGDSERDGLYHYEATGRGDGVQVHVYLIDTGVDALHSDFDDPANPGTSRIGTGVNATVPAGHPERSNIDDCTPHGHGTHVTAIAGGHTHGVAKRVVLHPVVFFTTCAAGTIHETAAVIEGIDWIIATHGKDPGQIGPGVVNFSGGNVEGWSDLLAAAVESLGAAGLLLVQAAGNQWLDGTEACDRSLGALGADNVLVAGGTDSIATEGDWIDGRWVREGPETTGGSEDPSYLPLCVSLDDCGSNGGPCVDLWAPAAHIISAAATGSEVACRLSGTSMAAPHVTGAAALYLEENPSASPAQVKQALLVSASAGVLEADPASPYSIGAGSANRLLSIRFPFFGDGFESGDLSRWGVAHR